MDESRAIAQSGHIEDFAEGVRTVAEKAAARVHGR
jgi:hypothetical protein